MTKNTKEFRTLNHPDYSNYRVNTKVLKQTYIQLNREFSSYYAAIKSYSKTPEKFKGKPKLPNYKNKKSGRNVVTFPRDAISFKKREGYIHLSQTNIYIKPYRANIESIKEIKIVPNVGHYSIFISYEIDNTEMNKEHEKYAAIDLGLNNLATLSSNDSDFSPIIINGRPLKSINQYYNKSKAEMTSKLPEKTYISNSIKRLTRKRNNKIKNYMHQASTTIVNYLKLNDITCLIVGSNKHWKTNISMGKRNNQNFVNIPFNKLKHMLSYKCEMAGIEYVETEESYTSKCSFLDMEDISKQEKYLGKRIRRGLFKSSNGVLINADLNGSYNIMRKVAGNDVFTLDSVEDYAVNPVKIHM